jgi:hypothetical protein
LTDKRRLKIRLTGDLSSPYNGKAEFSIRRRDGFRHHDPLSGIS